MTVIYIASKCAKTTVSLKHPSNIRYGIEFIAIVELGIEQWKFNDNTLYGICEPVSS